MSTFKLTDKYGNVFDAVDNNCSIDNCLSVRIDGAWCLIPKNKSDDPRGYLKVALFSSNLFDRPFARRIFPNKNRLSYRCKGKDYMWRDKAGKWHVAYPNSDGHKDCKANKTLANVPVWDSKSILVAIIDVDCRCPCHKNWDPKFATSFNDKMVKDDISDADLVNAMF